MKWPAPCGCTETTMCVGHVLEARRKQAPSETTDSKAAFEAGVKWGREMYPEDKQSETEDNMNAAPQMPAAGDSTANAEADGSLALGLSISATSKDKFATSAGAASSGNFSSDKEQKATPTTDRIAKLPRNTWKQSEAAFNSAVWELHAFERELADVREAVSARGEHWIPVSKRTPEHAEINRQLRGRSIVKIRLRRFNARINRKGVVWATNPLIELDDGTTISFLTQETETGEYGVELCISNQPSDIEVKE